MKLPVIPLALLTLALTLTARSQEHAIQGDPVVSVNAGSYYGILPPLSTVTGTNANTVDFSQALTVWTPGAGTAIRFSLVNKPTAATNGGSCQLQIIGTPGTLLTNVADAIVWKGAWGTLNAATNYVDIWWDGVTLNAQQSPVHGVIAPTQITSNQNDYNPTGLATADELRINTDATRTLTGLQGRVGGQLLLLENVGSFPLILSETNSSSVTTNQFRNGYDVILGNHQTALLIYSVTSQKWKATGTWQSHPAVQTLTDGSTITITVDPVKAVENQTVTLGGNRTLAISGATSGTTGVLKVVQNGSGNNTLTLPAGSKVISGGSGAITLSTAANAIDILTWWYDGTNYFWNKGINYN